MLASAWNDHDAAASHGFSQGERGCVAVFEAGFGENEHPKFSTMGARHEPDGNRSWSSDGKGNLRLTAGSPVHGLQAGQTGQDSELPNRHRLAIPKGLDWALDDWTEYVCTSVIKVTDPC
jgi:hypothetical protein